MSPKTEEAALWAEVYAWLHRRAELLRQRKVEERQATEPPRRKRQRRAGREASDAAT